MLLQEYVCWSLWFWILDSPPSVSRRLWTVPDYGTDSIQSSSHIMGLSTLRPLRIKETVDAVAMFLIDSKGERPHWAGGLARL